MTARRPVGWRLVAVACRAMLAFAWLSLSASAQSSPPLAYRRVFVPEAELSTQIRGLLPLRRDDFERRIKLAERQRDQPAQAATVRIAAADYRAQFSRGQLVGGEAVLDIALRGAEPAVLPLAPYPECRRVDW
jgi:hypothetical protein